MPKTNKEKKKVSMTISYSTLAYLKDFCKASGMNRSSAADSIISRFFIHNKKTLLTDIEEKKVELAVLEQRLKNIKERENYVER